MSLTPLAAQLGPGLYSGGIIFRNDTVGAERERQFTLQVGLSPITFDDLGRYDANGGAVPAGYAGLDWSNMDFLSAIDSTNTPNGYQAGMVSPENVAYNPNGNPASIIGVSPFDLISAYMTAAWRDNLLVEAAGYSEGVVVRTFRATLSATAPTLVSFNFFGVDRVDFVTSGGTPHPGYQESGSQFAMDNVLAVVQPSFAEAPILQVLSPTSNLAGLVGTTQVGRSYQLQSTTDLSQRNWASIGGLITATNTVMKFSDSSTNLQTFYRLLVLP